MSSEPGAGQTASLVAGVAEGAYERDPTVAFRLALDSYRTRPNFGAKKVLTKVYNGNALFFRNVFRDVRDADLNPDGETALIISGVFGPPSAKVVHLRDSTEVLLPAVIQQYGGRFVENGKRILTWSEKGKMTLWELNGHRVEETQIDLDELSQPCLDADGKLIASAVFDNVHVWDMTRKGPRVIEVSKATDETSRVFIVCSPKNGVFLERRYESSSARVWSFDGTFQYAVRSRGAIRGAQFSPTGLLAIFTDAEVTIWQNGEEKTTIPFPDGEITSIHFAREHLLVALLNGKCHYVDVNAALRGNAEKVVLTQDSPRALDVVSPNNAVSLVSLGRRDGSISVYDLDGVLMQRAIGHAPGDGLNSALDRIVWDKADKTLLTHGRDLTVRIWHTKSARFRLLRNTPNKRYGTPTWSPYQELMAVEFSTPTEHGVELYTIDGKLVKSLGGHAWFIRTTIFAPDGRIITHSNDRIQIWPGDGRPVIIANSGQYFSGKLALSKDMTKLVLTDIDNKYVGAWTLTGDPIVADERTRKADERSTEDKQTTADEEPDRQPKVQWLRAGDRYGFVFFNVNETEQDFVPAELGAASIASSRVNDSGFVWANGEKGTEWFLVDATKIIRLQSWPGADNLLWARDPKEDERLGILGLVDTGRGVLAQVFSFVRGPKMAQ